MMNKVVYIISQCYLFSLVR